MTTTTTELKITYDSDEEYSECESTFEDYSEYETADEGEDDDDRTKWWAKMIKMMGTKENVLACLKEVIEVHSEK